MSETDYAPGAPPAPTASSWTGEQKAVAIALLCFALAVFFAKASDSTVPATDAARYAALSMSATAHGFLPDFSSMAGVSQPISYFVLSGWVMRAFGPDSWSARLVPGLFSVGSVMLLFSLGRVLRSTMLGLVAGIILVLSRDFITDGLNAHLNNVMLFFILASFVLWEKNRPILAGIVAGLGIWFKSPVALLLYPTMLIAHLFRFDLLPRFKPLLKSFAVALAVGSLIWVLTGVFGNWDLVREYWLGELAGAVVAKNAQQTFDPFLFLGVLRLQYLPWSIFLAIGVIWNIVFFRFRRAEFIVPAAAAVLVIGAISCVQVKYPHSFVPAYPFLALIGAQPLTFWLEKRELKTFHGFMAFTLLAMTFILASPLHPAPESFPSLRKFMAYIQSSGSCDDRVVMVEGGQPYGGFNDYANLIQYYTGRNTLLADCQTVNLAAQKRDVKWILIAGKNYGACLDDSVRRLFPKQVVDGDQVLLARPQMIVGGEAGKIDLTPLNRELKAVRDCQPIELKSDKYHSYGEALSR